MFNLSKLVRLTTPTTCLNVVTRQRHFRKTLTKKGSILVNGTIRYYPREGDKEIPKIENPSKLFRVERTGPIKGNPYWERKILRDLGLYESPNVAVVKNIPENNARLWKIKHLVKITPIQFPNGEPTENDINYTFLKENGDCVVVKEIDQLQKRFEAADKYDKESKMDSELLKKDSRKKWMNPW